MNNKRVLTLLMCFAFIVGIIVGPRILFTKKNLSKYADEVFAKCKTVGFPPSCYDEEIPKLMNRISMEEAFDVTRLIQKKDPRYLYCHVLAHKVAYTETSKDLTKWKDVVARCPATFCNNGCQHGAIMRRFNTETLTSDQIEKIKPDLSDVCEPRGRWHPTEVERSMCYHSIGHLFMYVTGADLAHSSRLCLDIGTKSDGRNYVQTCTEGVFMTMYQPLEPEDFALVKGLTPTRETVAAFCSKFAGLAWQACRLESWPLFIDEVKTPSGLLSFCSYSDDPILQKTCVSAAMNILTIYFIIENNNNLDTLKTFCMALPGQKRENCFANAATRLIQIDPTYTPLAVDVCKMAYSLGVGGQCYNDMLSYSTYSFHEGSRELTNYCDALGDPWKQKCLAGEVTPY